MKKKTPSLHPGVVLKQTYMDKLELTLIDLAVGIKVMPSKLSPIISGTKPITVDIAVRLAIYFKTTPHLWLKMQCDYDLEKYMSKEGKTTTHLVKPHKPKIAHIV